MIWWHHEVALGVASLYPLAMTTEPTYETIFAQLQALVTKLEKGDLGLENVTALYEEGVKLAAQCQELLKATEDKIRRIQRAHAFPEESGEGNITSPEDGQAI